MKRIITYMVAVFALVLMMSCTRERLQDSATDGNAISIQLVWSEISTRSAGVDKENTVNSLDWYFYADTTEAVSFHYRQSVTTAADGKYTQDFVPGTQYGGVAFPDRVALCGANGYCTVFVVANLPQGKVTGTPTLEELKSVVVDETFLDETGVAPLATNAADLFFIMTGQKKVKGTTVKLESATPEVIELSRLAAKITYDVKVLKEKVKTATDGTSETWTPMLSGNNVRMYPQGVLTKANLGVVDGKHYLENPTDFIDYSILVVSSDSPSKWDVGEQYYETKATIGPYYAYPHNWKEGGSDTFIKIIVPWQVVKKDASGNVTYSAQREVYYKVLLPEPEVLANTWYQLEITLEPGTENEPEVEILANYKVANWITGGEQGVDGVLKDIKYLIADRSDEVTEGTDKHFVTYTRSISIPYSASNPVIFKVIEASYRDFYTETPTEKKFVQNNSFVNPTNTSKIVGTTTDGVNWSRVQNLSTVEGWFKFDNGSTVGAPEGRLVLDHWLNGDLTSDYFDVSPYTFTVRIYLQRDQEHYVEEIKIVQYPQTYIEAQESTVKLGTANSSNPFIGYIFVNGVERTTANFTTNDGRATAWTNITALGSAYSGKTNHNMYILTTTVLSDPEMRLGDPRESTSYSSPRLVGNLENGRANGQDKTEDFITAPAVGGGNRSLENYYPTDKAKSPTFIAPKLRISSAFGRRGSNNAGSNSNDDYRYNYASAWNRCAAYQEDGYPAGRWRLPTEAEIDYVNRLSTRQFIPQLFQGSTPYWTATPGKAVNGSGTMSVLSASTRCVYDDWYWGSDPVDGAQSTFMWGD